MSACVEFELAASEIVSGVVLHVQTEPSVKAAKCYFKVLYVSERGATAGVQLSIEYEVKARYYMSVALAAAVGRRVRGLCVATREQQ